MRPPNRFLTFGSVYFSEWSQVEESISWTLNLSENEPPRSSARGRKRLAANASLPLLADSGPHSTKKLFMCATCNKSYRHATSLSKHRLYECGKEPQQKCPFCPHVTKLKENLKKHVKDKHFRSGAIAEWEGFNVM